MLVDLHFLRPLWFLALIPLAIVVALLWQRRRGAEVWQGVVDPHLLPHLLVGTDGRGRWFPALLLALSGALVITAIAGPVWQRLPQPLFETHIDRVILLDLSPTMNAGDLKPSRLARARFEVLDLLRQAREGQTALLAFGPEPYVVSPLTSDADTIALQVPHLDTALLPEPGRRRVDLALNKAGDLLDRAGAVDAEVILITDGLDIADRDAVAAVALKEAGHRLSILGVGTPEGAPVPTGDGGFLEDRSGAILMPRLDAARLAWLAAAGGGDYVSARLDDRDTLTLMDGARLASRRAVGSNAQMTDQWREEGPWLLLAALPLLALGFRRGWLLMVPLILLGQPVPEAHAFGWVDLWQKPDQRAAQALADGRSSEAAQTFEDPRWRAAAQYQSGDFEGASATLEGVDSADAHYNRGNALAWQGRLEEALAAYDRSLELNDNDEDARYNRGLVRRLLDQQAQQEQQQEQQRQSEGGQQDSDQAQDGQQGREVQGLSIEREHGDGSNDSKSTNQGGGESEGAEFKQSEGSTGDGETESNDQETGQREEQQAPAVGQRTEGQQSAADSGEDQEPDGGSGHDVAVDEERQGHAGAQGQPLSQSEVQSGREGSEPLEQDLLGSQSGGQHPGQAVPTQKRAPMTEQEQSLEQQLRRVPDDPAGLLRQRFILQHLRRQGILP